MVAPARQEGYFHYLFGVIEEGFWGAVDTRNVGLGDKRGGGDSGSDWREKQRHGSNRGRRSQLPARLGVLLPLTLNGWIRRHRLDSERLPS
jgi:hypothetical protein